MAVSPTLSTVEVIPAPGGNEPNGTTVAQLRVTARDTSGALLATRAQVHVSCINDPGGQFPVDHEHEATAVGLQQFDATYTTNAVALIDLRANMEATARYLVEVGEDDAQINYTEAGQFGKPERDFAVGPTLAYVRQFTTPQTIDDAWLLANNTFGGVTSPVIRQTLFDDTVTLARNGVSFSNCIFATLASVDHSLVTDNHVFAAANCFFRGSGVAAVQGEGGVYTRCKWDQTGMHAVAIEQSGSTISAPPDDFTESRFLGCLFRRIGIVTPGSALSGTPARNVRYDHCWFDMADSAEPVIYQITEADGARGPFLVGCWIDSGTDVPIEVVTGASAIPQQFLLVRACRFGLEPGETYIENAGQFPASQSNLAPDGEPIDNAEHPGANLAPGLLWAFPRVSLSTIAEVEWVTTTGGGGGGGPGGGTGGGVPGTGSTQPIGTDVVFVMRESQGEPVGGGGTGGVIRARRINETILPAVPVPVGGGGTPPGSNPLVVQWLIPNSLVSEGNSVTIFAELKTIGGQIPNPAELAGYSVPLTISYQAFGPAVAGQAEDFVIPTELNFAPGSSLGSIVVEAVDDVSTEGLENVRLTLNQVLGELQGQTVVVVVPGTASFHDCSIEPSDPIGSAVTVFWGAVSDSIIEPDASNTPYFIPLRISGDPTAPVVVQITFTGTASYPGGPNPPADYGIVTPTVPGSPNVCQVVFFPTGGPTPADINIALSIIGDTTFEPDETVIATLTVLTSSTVAVAGATSVFTLTIENNDPDPGDPPVMYFPEQAVTLFEAIVVGGVPTLSTRSVEVRARSLLTAFAANSFVNIEVINLASGPSVPEFGIDYDILFDPPNAGNFNGAVGQLPFAAGQNRRSLVLRGIFDVDQDDGEQFLLRILPGNGYAVDPTDNEVIVTLRDPLGANGEVFCQRIQDVGSSLVRCTVALTNTVTTATGVSMSGNTCQWYPVAYKADGTPDTVHVWGLVAGNTPSVPGATGAITVQGGELGNPSGLLNLATQFSTITASGLNLVLRHNVVGEARDFELDLTTAEALIDSSNPLLPGYSATGPRLFRRYIKRGPLRALPATSIANDFCTVARAYIDCRADMNAVKIAINWGNYRWDKPLTDAGQYQPNAYVNGEVYFDELCLEGIPAGWAAVVQDPRTAISDYEAGLSRVRIIKSLGATARHYVPPLRGHVAYIVLYETATVSPAVATDILRGRDCGVVVGGIGLDRNDAFSELGTPILNYGEGAVPFENRDNGGGPGAGATGWAGADAFSLRERNRIRNAIVAGTNEYGGGNVQQGWWHGLSFPDGGAPAGDRIGITGGVCPGLWKVEKTQLELIHLWQRTGTVAWNSRAEPTTDEDFCTGLGTSGSPYRMATAMWRGIGGQRMAHHQFYTPDFLTQGSGGVGSGVRIGPGRKRATGTITIAAAPIAGDTVTVSDGVHAAVVFTYGGNWATGATTTAARDNLITAINAAAHPVNFTVKAYLSPFETDAIQLWNRFPGTAGNAALAVSTPGLPAGRITVVGMNGGLDTNANGLRLWNYLVQGSHSCATDIETAWHIKTIDGIDAFHSHDWPHMARMNEVTRDGWWLYLDPIAHDITMDLTGLAMQCLQRYPEDRSSIYFTQPSGATQLYSSYAGANLFGINESHNGRYLRHFVSRGFYDTTHAIVRTGNALAFNDGLRCGSWITRNALSPVPFNPQTVGSSTDFGFIDHYPIGRDFGWMLCTVARGYCISPAHQVTATMLERRTQIHNGGAAWNTFRPSWFDSIRQAMDQTAHASGAASSADLPGASSGAYTLTREVPGGMVEPLPPIFFDGAGNVQRTGSLPGGEFNDATPTTHTDEWYAHNILWHNNYVAFGCYAVLKRVYSDVDFLTRPTSNVWLTSTRRIFGFLKLCMLAAAARMGRVFFLVPRFHITGIGEPTAVGTAGATGRFGRFSQEPNPEVIFRRGLANQTGDVWWWSETTAPDGSFQLNHYAVEYFLGCFVLNRIRTLPADDLELIDLMPGLIAQGGAPISTTAPGTVAELMERMHRTISNDPFSGAPDETVWAVQWLRNEFGAP